MCNYTFGKAFNLLALENIKQNKGSSNENLSYLSIWHKTSVLRSELCLFCQCVAQMTCSF